MNPLNDSHKSRPSRLSRLALASPPILIDGKIFESAKGWRFAPGLFATLTLLILPFGAAQLLAQQAPQQDWPPDDAPNGQYSTGQQPGYTQPQYAQAPQYGQQQGYSQPYQGSAQPFAQQGYGEAQPLNADQLEQMVAPIALYPDSLVAQILAASTYPAQVSAADQWLQAQGNAPPEQIAAGASAQTSWDPSIKALTAFPQVLAMLDRNLQWTTSLGNAYYNQPQDVLQTIQVMRERAEQAGNLQSTPQAEVSNNQGYIDIAPPNPQVVYVPAYNPWDVYGQPVAPYPGFSLMGALGSFFGSSPVQYGMGIAMSAFMNTPFGWLGWGLDWLAHSILFNHGDYFTHSRSVTDWGFPHGGPRAYPGRPEWSRGRNENGWSHEGITARAVDTAGVMGRPSRIVVTTDTTGVMGRPLPTRLTVIGTRARPRASTAASRRGVTSTAGRRCPRNRRITVSRSRPGAQSSSQAADTARVTRHDTAQNPTPDKGRITAADQA